MKINIDLILLVNSDHPSRKEGPVSKRFEKNEIRAADLMCPTLQSPD